MQRISASTTLSAYWPGTPPPTPGQPGAPIPVGSRMPLQPWLLQMVNTAGANNAVVRDDDTNQDLALFNFGLINEPALEGRRQAVVVVKPLRGRTEVLGHLSFALELQADHKALVWVRHGDSPNSVPVAKIKVAKPDGPDGGNSYVVKIERVDPGNLRCGSQSEAIAAAAKVDLPGPKQCYPSLISNALDCALYNGAWVLSQLGAITTRGGCGPSSR